MPFQSTVNFERALGVPGEIFLAGPTRAQPALLNSASAAYNIIGATAFTVSVAASDGDPNTPIVAVAGGTGVFAGILAAPKTYASFGTSAGGALAPTMTLPNDWNAELLFMGEMVVTLPAACTVGDLVAYNTTTGALSTVVPLAKFTASIAPNTDTNHDVLTVSAVAAGALAVGQIVSGTGIDPGTYIIAQLTGSAGSTGTYQLSSNGQTVSSEAMTAPSVAGSGKAFVPNCTVDRYAPTGAGLAVIKLTN